MSGMAEDALRRRPARVAEVIARDLGEGLVLLDTRDEQYYSLDEVGAFIWHQMDGRCTVAELATAVAQEYDAAEATIQQDALEILEDLASAGVIAWQDD
ncbi:MAG TPA: PqqD family protein [Ktedonobacterales bacterium]|nr:PqqD family protein [Ktedonobacterales bacterium]